MAVAELEQAHRERVEALRARRIVGGESKPIGAIRLKPRELDGVEILYEGLFPQQRRSLRAVIAIDDVIGALRTAGEPEPAEPMPGGDVLANAFKVAEQHMKAVDANASMGVRASAPRRSPMRPSTASLPTGSSSPGTRPSARNAPMHRAELLAQESD